MDFQRKSGLDNCVCPSTHWARHNEILNSLASFTQKLSAAQGGLIPVGFIMEGKEKRHPDEKTESIRGPAL